MSDNPKIYLGTGSILFGLFGFWLGDLGNLELVLIGVGIIIVTGLYLIITTKEKSTFKAVAGMVFLVSGLAIYAFIKVPFILFALPLIIIGLVYLLFSGYSKKFIAVSCISPLLLLLLFTQLRKGEDEIYLIPKGFMGPIRVQFEEKNGVEINYEDGKRIYEIPSTGILFTKAKSTNYHRVRYFWVDAAGNRTAMKFYPAQEFESYYTTGEEEENPLKDSLGVIMNGMYGEHNGPHVISFVGTYSYYQSTKRKWIEDEEVDSLRQLMH